MDGKRKMMVIMLLLALIAGAAIFLFLRDSRTLPAAVENFADVPLTSQGSSDAATNQGETAMATNYDLTTDAEGLSKAIATMTLENGGVIKWRFYSNDAPNTVKRITQLISEGFYNGIIFHRVVPNFVVQAGDPKGLGIGGSGVKLKAEFNHHKHVKGIVSMARTSDPDSADSQFFIMIGEAPNLDGQYTAFGKVVEGYNHVEEITQGTKIKSFVIE